MTTRAKELADRLRERFETNRADLLGLGYGPEIVEHLDRLAAIDSAAPGEVREIQERHEQDLKDAKVSRVAARSWTDAHNDRATLLAIVQRQVGEVATLTTNQETIRACLQDGLGFKDWTGQHLDIEWLLGRAGTEYRSRVRLQQQLDAARAEVERLAALVDDFKAASMLDVGGDPDGVTPRLLERHVAALQNEVERLKDAGVTIHACPPKGECMMPCCGRPPFEVMGSRMTTNPALVNCDRHRLLGEVERLKGELHDARTAELNALNAHESTIRRHSEFAQRHTSMEAQLVTELTAQTDKLRSERSSLAAENARLVSEHAAAMARADVLAEGVRLFWGDNGWSAAAALEWKRKHGHLVGDGK